MPISYAKLFELLKEKGYTTYKIRQEKLIGQGTLTALKNGTGGLDAKTIARLCEVLDCQPGDLMEYVKEPSAAAQENNWFPIHFSACSNSPKSAGYTANSVQQTRSTLLRTGGCISGEIFFSCPDLFGRGWAILKRLLKLETRLRKKKKAVFKLNI